MTTKQAGHGFYKGNRTGTIGSHTKWATFVINWAKVKTYKMPDNLEACEVGQGWKRMVRWVLTEIQLTPFVANRIERPVTYKKYDDFEKGAGDGRFFLEQWKHKSEAG